MSSGAAAADCWLILNRYGGMSVGHGSTAAQAKTEVREAIAESFASEGLSASDCRRAGYSYGVRVYAGGCTYDEAREAAEAWNAGSGADDRAAIELRARWQKAQRTARRQRARSRNAAVAQVDARA